MGESSGCLVRSFSHPSPTSCRNDEGDPLRALTSSISFGRFVSESLAWEKWSSFTQNRYLEEVEKCSKPGSVAAMKAHFEAHYKRVAAKKAAALLEQENKVANISPQPSFVVEINDNSTIDSNLVNSKSGVPVDEKLDKEVSSSELVFSMDSNRCNVSGERKEVEISPNEGVKAAVEQLVLEGNCTEIESSKQLQIVEEQSKIKFTQDKSPAKDSTNLGDLESSIKRKPAFSSSKSKANSSVSKFQNLVKPTKPVHPRDNATTNSKKAARDAMGKNKSTSGSLHMSINFAPRAGEASKTSVILNRITSSKIIKSFVKTNKESLSKLAPTRASSYGASKHNTVTNEPENRRSKVLLDRPVCRSGIMGGKTQCLSTNNTESSSASGRIVRPPSISSFFSFRSEERVAKCKEFPQKLEGKFNKEEAVKVPLQAKSKIPPTCPRSPKLGRKPASSKVQDTTFSRPPWRSSGKMDGSISKHVAEKNKQTPTHSLKSLPKKNMRENASPNIWL